MLDSCAYQVESEMDTCSSPENPDSRKRPRDPESENGVSKRSNYGGGQSDFIFGTRSLIIEKLDVHCQNRHDLLFTSLIIQRCESIGNWSTLIRSCDLITLI